MVRRVFQPLAVAAVLIIVLNACSLGLKLDADCDEASECGAYRCDDANVACRDTCATHQECAGAFVCELGFGRCEGGFCQAMSPVVELGSTAEGFDEIATALVAPEHHEFQLVVVTGQEKGVALQRYHLPSFRRFSDPADAELGALRLDFPLATPFPLASASEEQASGMVRFVWATETELRTARLDSAAPWLYATESTHSVTEGATIQGLVAHGTHGGTQLAWEETCGEECTRPVSQHMRPDGSFTLARPLWMQGTHLSVVSDDARVEVLWLTNVVPPPPDPLAGGALNGDGDGDGADDSLPKAMRTAAFDRADRAHQALDDRSEHPQWAILSRSRAPDELYDLYAPPRVVYQGTGSPPEAAFAVRGDASILLFTRRANDLGRVDDELRVIADDGALRENISYTDGFSRIDELRVIPAMDAGAWVGVIGTWQGEYGVWTRYVSAQGVVDRYPVRVTDTPPTGTLEMLQISNTAGTLSVTWAAREDASAPRRGYSRLFACE